MIGQDTTPNVEAPGAAAPPAAPSYHYRQLFTLKPPEPAPAATPDTRQGDQATGREYVFTEEILLHVNIALATGRPLLVLGPPGSGKSSLARSVAYHRDCRYYQEVITSHTQARDLQWRFDHLRRLSDAQLAQAEPEAAARVRTLSTYVQPGVLWWAFEPASALALAGPAAADPTPLAHPEDAVVLLDEIDKADPDVPNDLLIPLGSYEFEVQETGEPIRLAKDRRPPLLVLTSNGERQLPNAFLRRCLTLVLSAPDAARLVAIATRHFGPDDTGLYPELARRLLAFIDDAVKNGLVPPGTAEFLDAVGACRQLEVFPDDADPTWTLLQAATLTKKRGQG